MGSSTSCRWLRGWKPFAGSRVPRGSQQDISNGGGDTGLGAVACRTGGCRAGGGTGVVALSLLVPQVPKYPTECLCSASTPIHPHPFSVLTGDGSQLSPWGSQRCPLPHPMGRSTPRMSPPAPVPVPTLCRSTQHPPSLPKAPLNAVTFPPDAHSRRLWGCLLTVLPAGWLSHRSHHQGTNPEHPPGLGGSRGPPLSPPHPPQLGSP